LIFSINVYKCTDYYYYYYYIIVSNWMEGLVLFTSLEYFVILSIIVIVRAGVGCTNVVCPHNGAEDLCICDFLEKLFSGHGSFVLSTIDLFSLFGPS